MQRTNLSSLTRLAQVVLLTGGSLFVIVYIVIAASRMMYPFELEWMEGAMLGQVERARAGTPLFVAPSMEYVPLIYTPLYYYIAAALSWVTGTSFFTLRLISFGASLGVFGLMYKLVETETGDWRAGLTAVSMFAATFVIGGAWFDIGRNDSLFLFGCLAGAYALRRSDTLGAALIAGFCFALAAFTKQSALLVAAPVVLYLLLTDWKRSLAFVAPLALVFGGSTAVLDAMSDGWYVYYTLELPREHAIVMDRIIGFWTDDMLGQLPIATLGGLAYLGYRIARPRSGTWFLVALAAGLFAAAWSSRMHSGGIENVLIPAYFALSLLFVLGLHHASQGGWGPARFAPLRPAALHALAGLQFFLLVYNPAAQIPTSADRAAGEMLVSRLAEVDGPVWVPGQPYLAERAGKSSYAHAVALQDVLRGGESPAKEQLAEDLILSLETRRFSALLLDGSFSGECPPRGPVIDDVNWICDEIVANYRRDGLLITDQAVFRPVAGSPRRPVILYRARSPDDSG